MSACEKCWGEAHRRMVFSGDGRSQTEHYADLLRERKDTPCTPEQQRGEHPERQAPRAEEEK